MPLSNAPPTTRQVRFGYGQHGTATDGAAPPLIAGLGQPRQPTITTRNLSLRNASTTLSKLSAGALMLDPDAPMGNPLMSQVLGSSDCGHTALREVAPW